ncbi:hypothetical protein LZ480_13910 [Solibacillus sp. MA9]|uniref:Uncharacterized protein n=1 Tax=Solibacillus palustris TaxID=2908203 RepID=A0ABS9UF32_9BACL|nr:hypothetical protein [Solibacillus sp. MA9]MCH7322970.1 hypothetical protein [Solibacillus sp. MA9]
MPLNYSSYQEIDPFYMTLFERLWDQYSPELPPLPTDIQNENNTKAAVFNIWVNYYQVKKYLFIKFEKNFLHAYDEHLANRLKISTPEQLQTILQSYRTKHHHAFLYCYFLALHAFNELTIFVNQHEEIDPPMLKKYNYYYLTDTDYEPHDEVFRIMKILTFEFLQVHLTVQKCERMHFFAYNDIQPYLKGC